MSDLSIRASLLERLQALTPAIGQVYDYERWVVDSRKFLDLFKDQATGKIFGWEISRVGFKVKKAAMNKWRFSHSYVIRGFYGLEDSAGTDKAVNGLADLIVLDLIRTRLPETENDLLPEGSTGTRFFGQVLCHVIEIKIPEVAEIVRPEEVDLGYLDVVGLNYYLKPGDDVADAVDIIATWDSDGDGTVSFDGSEVAVDGESVVLGGEN